MRQSSEPSPDDPEKPGGDRGTNGRFAKGCKPGPGNPQSAEVGRLRAKFFAAIRVKDVELAVKTILEVMGQGEKASDRLSAAKELLDRVIGKAVATDLLERIENLERTIGERKDRT